MLATRLRRGALSLVATSALVLIGLPALAQEPSQISMDDNRGIQLSTSEPLFVDGDYMWGVDMWVPFSPFGDTTADPPVPATPVTVTWDFGDGLTPTVVSSADTGDHAVWCNDEGGGAYRCSSWVTHQYAEQGVYRIVATAHQDGATDGALEGGQAIYDLAVGGTVKGSGTVWADTGGMYDQGFEPAGGGTLSFSINVKRRVGTAATTGSLVVSVPSMVADWPLSHPTGMTFTSRTATLPLLVKPLTARGYEVLLDRVYGTVTNSAGRVSTALASFHAYVRPGQPTLLRISVWNTSAGFTFVDTSVSPYPTRWSPDPGDILRTGSLRVS